MAKILLIEDNEMNRDMLSRRLVRQVSEITETEYFHDLQKKIKDLRHRPTT